MIVLEAIAVVVVAGAAGGLAYLGARALLRKAFRGVGE